MLFDIGINAIRAQQLPPDAPPWITVKHDGWTVAGDRAGYRETFVWAGTQRVIISTTLEELLDKMKALLIAPAISPFGISQILNHGFPPLPHTVFSDVSRLAAGDVAHVTASNDRVAVEVTSAWPWLNPLSREDQIPSTDKLRELIGTALVRQLDLSDGSASLMLSSGKDSVALALALADEGRRDVSCFTFKSGPEDNEHRYAADLCNQLKLTHHTFEMPSSHATTRNAVVRFFERSPLPSADQATIPYAIVTDRIGADHGAIIDGSGNDGYMGFLPSRDTRIKQGLRVRSRTVAQAVRNRIDHDSPLNYMTRSRADTSLPGRMFRARETRIFYPDAVDTEAFWLAQSREHSQLDPVDFLAMTKIRQTEPARSNPKIYLAARAHNMVPILPFCDEPLADYYFNLPEKSRFDRSTGTSKVLLRHSLSEAVGYDQATVGVNHFGFDGAAFLLENQRFVRDEIATCRLWSPDVVPLLNDWLEALPKRPFLYHSLLALFMISGWHNHSAYAPPVPGSS